MKRMDRTGNFVVNSYMNSSKISLSIYVKDRKKGVSKKEEIAR
jgi:hypothetical protein